MIITYDNFPLYIAVICAVVSCIAYLLASIKSQEGVESRFGSVARVCYYVSVASVVYTSVYLFQQILSNARYDIAYIYNYSSATDELLYRISAFWAGQEGSLLFWTLLCSLIGLVLLRRFGKSVPAMMSFWGLVQTFFLTILVVGDPFRKLVEYQPGMMGAGLNPLLKNPWMAIHPPILFLGYAALTVPAAFAIIALIKGDAGKWANKCLPWALFGWVSLSAGIILGMVWSYEVLGWGGYWGWDPVENASLVPWITSTALVHGLLLQRYRGRMAHSNIILSLSTFLLIIYATFLTRSGVLSDFSVHSFGDLGTYSYLLGFLIFFAVLCVGLTAVRWKAISGARNALEQNSKDFALTAGVFILVVFAGIVLVGTSYPIITGSAVRAQFYNHMSIPLALIMSILIALSPLVKWGRSNTEQKPDSVKPDSSMKMLSKAFLILVLISLACGVVAIIAPGFARRSLAWLVPAGSSMFRIAVPLLVMLLGSAILALIVSAIKCCKTSLFRAGAYITHAGVALFILGVILSSCGKSTTLSLAENGSSEHAYGYSFTYQGIEKTGTNKESMKINVIQGKREFDAPLFIQYSERGAIRSPFIRSSILGDLYISPVEIRSATVAPTASIGENGWVSLPVQIPDSESTLALVGMQVESHSITLQYTSPGQEPVEIVVAEGSPASVDGYTFAFQQFVSDGSKDTMGMTVGASIAVTGHDLAKKAVIEVSTKPFIALLWVGIILLLLGGTVAVIRRGLESGKN